MKKALFVNLIAGAAIAGLVLTGCGDNRTPSRHYMPDMGKSRAYETYGMLDSAVFTSEAGGRGGNKIYYNYKPVGGTIKRGELFPYTLPNDSNGYKMSSGIENPMDSIRFSMAEAGRLYNINCGICHGEKGAGNGPLSQKLGGIANLTLPVYVTMSDGTMFHSVTYGKGLMGSYASQLTREQRWQVIKYVRTLQTTTADAPATDSAATAKQ